MEATHFIEIFKQRGVERLRQSVEPQPIKFLDTSLKITRESATLKTIAVWKIAIKKNEQL